MKISGSTLSGSLIAKREASIAFTRFKPELRVAPHSQNISGTKALSRFENVLASQVESQRQMQQVSLTSTLLRSLYDSKLSLLRNIKGN